MDDTNVVRNTELARCVVQRHDDSRRGDGGKDVGHVLVTRSFIPDGGLRHDEVPRRDARLHAAGCSNAHKGVRAKVDQLFDRDRRRRSTDASRGDCHWFIVEHPRVGAEFPVRGDVSRLL